MYEYSYQEHDYSLEDPRWTTVLDLRNQIIEQLGEPVFRNGLRPSQDMFSIETLIGQINQHGWYFVIHHLRYTLDLIGKLLSAFDDPKDRRNGHVE